MAAEDVQEVPLEKRPDNVLRIIWRDDQGRRCTSFMEFDRAALDPSLLDALDAEDQPRQTVFLTSAVEDCQRLGEAYRA